MLAVVAYVLSAVGTAAALALRILGADPTLTFAVSAVAILGLAYTLGHATEQLGIAAGPRIGGIIGHPTGCGGNPVLGEQFLRLVFEEIHSAHHLVDLPAQGCNAGHIGL